MESSDLVVNCYRLGFIYAVKNPCTTAYPEKFLEDVLKVAALNRQKWPKFDKAGFKGNRGE